MTHLASTDVAHYHTEYGKLITIGPYSPGSLGVPGVTGAKATQHALQALVAPIQSGDDAGTVHSPTTGDFGCTLDFRS